MAPIRIVAPGMAAKDATSNGGETSNSGGTAPSSPLKAPASSTAFSVASAAKASVFVPGGVGGASSSSAAGVGSGSSSSLTPGMGIGAQEFVPKRSITPSLSEDAPYFTPASQRLPMQSSQQASAPPPGLQQHHNNNNQNNGFGMSASQFAGNHERHLSSIGPQQGQHQPDHLAEYYGQAMDLNGPADFNRGGQSSNQHPPPAHLLGVHPSEQQMYDFNQQGASMNASQDPYYSSHQPGMPSFVRQPLQYHLYHPLPSSSTHQQTQQFPSFFLPPSLHISLTQKLEATHATPSIEMKLPDEVGGYTGLLPLDKGGNGGAEGQSGWNGFRSWVYKAWKDTDGKAYALRRIEGFRLQHEAAITMVEKWTRLRHPGLVAVREAFTTRAFGDQSIILVYDYYPTSQTMWEAHLSPLSTLPPNPWSNPAHGGLHPHSTHLAHPTSSQSGMYRGRQGTSATTSPQGGGGIGLAERVLWSYIVQLGSVIKLVHNNGLAVRTLEVNRLLITGKNRVRLAGCGVLDVLHFEGGNVSSGYQQDDLLSFGKLIITLACGSPAAVHNLPKSVDHISRVYSPDLKNVVLYLLSKPGPRKSIEEVLALMGPRVLDEFNSSLVAEDTLESELLREVENGRLVRLLTKFGFINERPEFDHDPRWAETGDRYIIKLFRDYVFHQVDEQGRPVTDLSHVLVALNKLDAGTDEKIMLVSRDEQSCLIVSFREIKNCVDAAYLDLARASHHP